MAKHSKQILKIGLLVVLLSFFVYFSMHIIKLLPFHDFIEYWSASKLTISGGNPYSMIQMHTIQKSIGSQANYPCLMWNPPWILTLIMPLGIFDYNISRLMWFFLSLLTFVLAANLLWKHYKGNFEQQWFALLIVMFFTPTFATLVKGQTSFLLLIGVVGFLLLIKQEKGFWAGVFASLALVKPHVLYLFLLTVLLWSIHKKQFSVLIGMGSALALTTGIALLFNPDIIQQYLYAVKHYPPTEWLTPTLGSSLREALNHKLFWLQFIPSFAGCFWLIIYWCQQKKNWNWDEQTPLLTLVSVVSSSYAWIFDLVVIIPALIQGSIAILRAKNSISKFSIIIIFTVLNCLIFIGNYTQHILWWLGTFYFIFFLIVQHHSNPIAPKKQRAD